MLNLKKIGFVLTAFICCIVPFLHTSRLISYADDLPQTTRVQTVSLNGSLGSDSYFNWHTAFKFPFNYQNTQLKTLYEVVFTDLPSQQFNIVCSGVSGNISPYYVFIDYTLQNDTTRYTLSDTITQYPQADIPLNADTLVVKVVTTQSLTQGQQVSGNVNVYLMYGSSTWDLVNSAQSKAEAFNNGYLLASKNNMTIGQYGFFTGAKFTLWNDNLTQNISISPTLGYAGVSFYGINSQIPTAYQEMQTWLDIEFPFAWSLRNNGLGSSGEDDIHLSPLNILMADGKRYSLPWSEYNPDDPYAPYYLDLSQLPPDANDTVVKIRYYIPRTGDLLEKLSLFARDSLYFTGYNDGKIEGESEGFDAGYERGNAHGYENGYVNGYQDGLLDGNDTKPFHELLSAVIDVPISILRGLLNFDLLGFNLWSFAQGLFSLLFVFLVLKLIFSFV